MFLSPFMIAISSESVGKEWHNKKRFLHSSYNHKKDQNIYISRKKRTYIIKKGKRFAGKSLKIQVNTKNTRSNKSYAKKKKRILKKRRKNVNK